MQQENVRKILNVLTKSIKELIGGSADLAGSNNTKLEITKLLNPVILMVTTFIMELENMLCGGNEWNCNAWKSNTVWWNIFNFQ